MAHDLNLPTIADGQADGQWQSSNDADAALGNAIGELTAVDFTSGNVSMSAATYRGAMVFYPTNLSTNRTLTLPAVKKMFIFDNRDSTDSVTLKKTDGNSPETATSIVVEAGELFLGYTDGTASGLFGAILVSATSGGVTLPYDIPLSFAGTPTAGQLIGKVIAVRDIDFEANFSGSSGHVGTNPGATFAIDVQDDGASIGTLSVSTGGAFTFTTSGGTAKTVAAGSRIEFYAPANSPAEATVAKIAATLAGTTSF